MPTLQGFTYTGREYDSEIGLYYYRVRYYDPEVGRFVSKDPIGFAGGDVNLYNYTSGNPVNWMDPEGLNAITFNTLNSLKPLASQISMGDGPLPIGDVVALALLSSAGIYDLWIHYNENNGAKAPGKPTEDDGFEEGKDGGPWVPNPNGEGYGWRDKKGNVWCPTGPGSRAHGGPHWDVQKPGKKGKKRYDNIYPGGRKR